MIDIKRLKTNEEFNALEGEWNLLLRQSPVDDAFLTWEWIRTWWKHYGHSYELCLLVAREDQRLVGIAPFMLETQKVLVFKIRVLRNIGIPPPDVGGLIILDGREDVLEHIALWLVSNQTLWDVVLIGEVPQGGIKLDAWITQFEKRKFTSQVDTTRHFFIPIDGDWRRYCQQLSKGFRKEVNRNIRHAQASEGFHYDHKSGQAATTGDMETIFQINQNAHHSYLYRDRTEKDFHKELAMAMAAQGWLDLYFLYIGDVPVAFEYGFWYNQTFEMWRTGFDGAYRSFSPGRVLFSLMLQDGFENGMRFLDFLAGDEDYKRDWQVETRLFLNIRLVRKTPLALAAHIYYPRFKKRCREFLNRHTVMHPLLRRIEHFINLIQNSRVK